MATFPSTLHYRCPHCGGELRLRRAELWEGARASDGQVVRFRIPTYRCAGCGRDYEGESDPPGASRAGVVAWGLVEE